MNPDEDTAAPTSLVGLIDGLIEPAEPAAIPLTPQTWGWAALAILLLALAGWLLWRWQARRRANAYRRAALAKLARAATGAEVARTLRRAALAAFPRADVAGLAGPDWLGFLDRTGRERLPAEVGAELLAAPYRAETAPPSDGLRAAAEAWVRTHRTEARAPADRPSTRGVAA